MAPAANPMNDKTLPDIPIPADHTWTYDRKLGSGSEGTVHLWNLLNNSTQRTVRRIVTKNLKVVDSHIIPSRPAKGQLLQAYIQQHLVPNGSKEAFTVPTLGARKLEWYEDAWRTYHPYYSMGNFETLVHVNTRSRHAKFLPEPFIWFTLHRMMRAAVAMDERLRDTPGNGPVVIHNDIKSENIFLDHPGSLGRDADYIMYPPAYLGDFGMSYLTSEDESWRRKIRGTVGWCAPELDRGGNPDAPNDTARYDVAPTSRTNVWQIGYCILRAMDGDGLTAPVLGNHDLRYRNDSWTKRTQAGASAVYSADLIRVVEDCVRFQLADRPSPQVALALIEQHMPTYADGMDRWGTLSWIKAEHAKTDEAEHGDDADEEEDEDEDDTATTTAASKKRKATVPPPAPPPASKRSRFSGALKRRLELVAKQMKPGVRLGKVQKTDRAFILADENKIICPDVTFFDADEFFERDDPGPIEFEGEESEQGDTGAVTHDLSRPRASSTHPTTSTLREVITSRASSVPARASNDTAGGLYYFTPGDTTRLPTHQSRCQAARSHFQSDLPNPTTISTMHWRLEHKTLSYLSRNATNLHEKMYWLSRSVQAEYYAKEEYDTGKGCDTYIRMAISIWRNLGGGDAT
jgi:serine/threonine protein kinase